MTGSQFPKTIIALIAAFLAVNANANSVSLDMNSYSPDENGQIAVTVEYDFSEFAMFGGGINLIYDPSVIQFVSYTRVDPLPDDAQSQPSPVGWLDSEGVYIGAGIGTFDFFFGMTSAGEIGTFVFNVLALSSDGSNTTPCGANLCLLDTAFNPMMSLTSIDVTAELFANGITSANIVVPLPAAFWFLLTGLGSLVGLDRLRALTGKA